MRVCLYISCQYNQTGAMDCDFGHLDSNKKRHLFYDQPKSFSNNLLQIVKLFDGFFLGNHHAAKEEEFIINNKIGLILNLSPLEVQVPSHSHITVMTYDFMGKRGEIKEKVNISVMLDIIAKAQYCLQQKCQGVVIVSKIIDSKCATLASIFLMVKYSWSLALTLQLLHSKKQDLHISPTFYNILQEFDKNRKKAKISEIFQTKNNLQENILLRNTFVNSHFNNWPNFHGFSLDRDSKNEEQVMSHRSVKRKVKFVDTDLDYIQSKQSKNKNNSKIFNEKNKQIIGNFTSVSKNLRQFIHDKKLSKDKKQFTEHTSVDNFSTNSEIIAIKSKDIIKHFQRRRATSKTQEHQIIHRRDVKSNLSNQKKNLGNLQEQQNTIENADNYSSAFEMNIVFNKKHVDEQNSKQNCSNDKKTQQTAKYRFSKRCYTDNPKNQITQQDIQKQQNVKSCMTNNLFKITKSNKTSTKNFKTVSPNRIINNSYKNSDKRINFGNIDDTQLSERQSLHQVIQSKLCKGDMNNMSTKNHYNVVNFNVNLQIQNINFIHEKLKETQFGEDCSKNISKTFHNKIKSKKCNITANIRND